MISIAHRFGMSWVGDFDPTQGSMNASGCGHTMTSETIRGLGMVLRYSYQTGSRKIRNATGARRGVSYEEYLAPTETADKLHCGIVPIDPNATKLAIDIPDIYLIGSGRKFDMAELVNRVNISTAESDKLRDSKHLNSSYGSPQRSLKHAIEDAVSMLCPVPILPSS